MHNLTALFGWKIAVVLMARVRLSRGFMQLRQAPRRVKVHASLKGICLLNNQVNEVYASTSVPEANVFTVAYYFTVWKM